MCIYVYLYLLVADGDSTSFDHSLSMHSFKLSHKHNYVTG
jgi:hypothetical protein